eukprot:3801615-Rhodomonas_salina.1
MQGDVVTRLSVLDVEAKQRKIREIQVNARYLAASHLSVSSGVCAYVRAGVLWPTLWGTRWGHRTYAECFMYQSGMLIR